MKADMLGQVTFAMEDGRTPYCGSQFSLFVSERPTASALALWSHPSCEESSFQAVVLQSKQSAGEHGSQR